jgi:hypothetical protein
MHALIAPLKHANSRMCVPMHTACVRLEGKAEAKLVAEVTLWGHNLACEAPAWCSCCL